MTMFIVSDDLVAEYEITGEGVDTATLGIVVNHEDCDGEVFATTISANALDVLKAILLHECPKKNDHAISWEASGRG